jgi:hypothetical protein
VQDLEQEIADNDAQMADDSADVDMDIDLKESIYDWVPAIRHMIDNESFTLLEVSDDLTNLHINNCLCEYDHVEHLLVYDECNALLISEGGNAFSIPKPAWAPECSSKL